MSLTITLGNEATAGPSRPIGDFEIDSTKMVVIDRADLEEHWTREGKDRIGVISTAFDKEVLSLLTTRFELRSRRVNAERTLVVGPISLELEKEIETYLKTQPKYRDFPSDYFRVETNSSLDRACHLERAWGFIPAGDEGSPLMFVCGTGRGDGVYDAYCSYSGDVPSVLSIEFIEDHESGAGSQ